MVYSYNPQGVCAQEMIVEVDEQGVGLNLETKGGCNGNLKGIAALVKGMHAKDVIARLKGVECGFKGTSCPDQIALMLEKVLEEA